MSIIDRLADRVRGVQVSYFQHEADVYTRRIGKEQQKILSLAKRHQSNPKKLKRVHQRAQELKFTYGAEWRYQHAAERQLGKMNTRMRQPRDQHTT